MALSSERPFDVSKLRRDAIGRISSLDYGKLRSTLIPVLRLDCKLDIAEMKNAVVDYLNKTFVLSESELLFVENFNSNVFEQRLLFGQNEVNDLSNHPMVKWKLGH